MKRLVACCGLLTVLCQPAFADTPIIVGAQQRAATQSVSVHSVTDISQEFSFYMDGRFHRDYLSGHGRDVRNWGTLSKLDLSNSNLLVLVAGDPRLPYSAAAVSHVAGFVREGGTVLLMGDGADPMPPGDTVAAAFDAGFSTIHATAPLRGVGEITGEEVFYYGGTRLRLGSGWTPLVVDQDDQPVLAVRRYGAGHVVLGSRGLFGRNPDASDPVNAAWITPMLVSRADDKPIDPAGPHRHTWAELKREVGPLTLEFHEGTEPFANGIYEVYQEIRPHLAAVTGVEPVPGLLTRMLVLPTCCGGFASGQLIAIGAWWGDFPNKRYPMLELIAHEAGHVWVLPHGEPVWNEPIATWFGIKVGQRLGYPEADQALEGQIAEARKLDPNFTRNPAEPGTHRDLLWGKSYFVFEELERLYGPQAMAKYFRTKRRLIQPGRPSYSMDDCVAVWSIAVGKDLFPWFRSLGFDVDVSRSDVPPGANRPPEQVGALVALYNATGGPNWKNNTNWLSESPLDDWYGVTASNGRVTELHLHDNQLTGAIPPQLGSLSHLTWLGLHDNQLTGTLPQSLTGLGALERFYFNLNPGLCAQADAAIRTWLNGVSSVRGPDCSPTVRLSINPSRLVEGAGPIPVTVTAARTAVNSATAVTLGLGGSARLGTDLDYTLSGRMGLTIPANNASGTTTLTFTPLADNQAEDDEIIILEAEVEDKIEGSATLTLSDTAAGTPGSSGFFVPVILTSAGRNNSFFTSELTLTNRGSEESTLRYTYTARAGGGSGTATDRLAPGRQRIEPDAIGYLIGLGISIPDSGNHIGTLRVEVVGSSEVSVMVRTTTAVPDGRAGLAYPGIVHDEGFQEAVYLCGLRENRQDRSNVAFQNMGSPDEGPITLRTTLFSGEADDTSSLDLGEVTLKPGDFHQYSGLLERLGSPAQGYVKVEKVEGSAPFYAYGVINDNFNSDGSFVFPLTQSSLVGASGQTLPVIIETGAFTSELTITNFSAVEKTVGFSFVADAIGKPDDSADFSLKLRAGEQMILPHFVDWLRRRQVAGIGPVGSAFVGALFATVTEGDMSGIVIGARTGAPDNRGGQYSLFCNGVPYGSASIESAWIYGLQQNAENRSNLAVVNTGEVDDSASTFEITIYDGGGDAQPRTKSITLGPRRWDQENGILGNVRQGYVQVRKVSGNNPFITYGVINDGGKPRQRSDDGAYVPAQN